MKEKHDQIMAWLDLPLEERPQLITGKAVWFHHCLKISTLVRHVAAYEPSLDQAGHLTGPKSPLVNVSTAVFGQSVHEKRTENSMILFFPYQKVLREVDTFAKDIHDSLSARNLTDIVDVVFVSDHGMTDTSHPELIYVDDILGDGFGLIEHEDGLYSVSTPSLLSIPLNMTIKSRCASSLQFHNNSPHSRGNAYANAQFSLSNSIGWPSMGIRFSKKANSTHYLNVLLDAAKASNGKFDVYTHETMPERFHFSHNDRIAPIYVIPKVGYELTNRIENGTGMSKGVSMRVLCCCYFPRFSVFSSLFPLILALGIHMVLLRLTKIFLCHRIMDTTTRSHRCMLCSWPTDHSRPLLKRSIHPVRTTTYFPVTSPSDGPTRDGIAPPMIRM